MVRRGSLASEKSVHSMKKMCVDTSQCLLKKGVAWSSVKTEPLKELGVEVNLSNKVAIPKTGVELEYEEDKEGGNWTGRPRLDLLS